jgi:hypothetical protein
MTYLVGQPYLLKMPNRKHGLQEHAALASFIRGRLADFDRKITDTLNVKSPKSKLWISLLQIRKRMKSDTNALKWTHELLQLVGMFSI